MYGEIAEIEEIAGSGGSPQINTTRSRMWCHLALEACQETGNPTFENVLKGPEVSGLFETPFGLSPNFAIDGEIWRQPPTIAGGARSSTVTV